MSIYPSIHPSIHPSQLPSQNINLSFKSRYPNASSYTERWALAVRVTPTHRADGLSIAVVSSMRMQLQLRSATSVAMFYAPLCV
ncbi:hypothetical protein BD410DRAFT_488454 [Rickenella mellea]|uniref:Uncharacterized protein n=1 Tax=Rickenella mellea TaxID=50990 RepID=A0A4Y7PVR6_9AGAM|nr:hypothetical protein BD410DRAFT_488454 [Rickenella mellea]